MLTKTIIKFFKWNTDRALHFPCQKFTKSLNNRKASSTKPYQPKDRKFLNKYFVPNGECPQNVWLKVMRENKFCMFASIVIVRKQRDSFAKTVFTTIMQFTAHNASPSTKSKLQKFKVSGTGPLTKNSRKCFSSSLSTSPTSIMFFKTSMPALM